MYCQGEPNSFLLNVKDFGRYSAFPNAHDVIPSDKKLPEMTGPDKANSNIRYVISHHL